ncbi:hypothetical protein QQ045_014250 [Rhodiola kirilowii]
MRTAIGLVVNCSENWSMNCGGGGRRRCRELCMIRAAYRSNTEREGFRVRDFAEAAKSCEFENPGSFAFNERKIQSRALLLCDLRRSIRLIHAEQNEERSPIKFMTSAEAMTVSSDEHVHKKARHLDNSDREYEVESGSGDDDI